MNRTILNLAVLLLAATAGHAQYKSTDYWQEHPQVHAVPAEYAKESSVIIEGNTLIRYEDGDDNKLVMYRTVHRIIKVLDDKGIEDFNKMSVPVYPGQELETIKARTILPGGKVIEVAREKMKESKGEDEQTNIAFAMDGVEKNAEIEWLITYKKQPVWYSSEILQYSIPVMHASFALSSPSRLKFEEKGYQGFPTVQDTLIDKTRYISASYSNIPALTDEPYSNYDANRMKVDYKLSYEPDKKDGVRIFTWQELAEQLYSSLYELSDKEGKAVEKYLATIGVTESDKEEDKIIKIEHAIKSGITLYKVSPDAEALKLYNVIANKSATENSLLRLFTACFVKAGIKHEFGMTTNRHDYTFDPDFENWNTLDKYLFYFPGSKKFLSPVAVYIRYPFTETAVLDNKGVFCKLTTIGEVTKVIADIRTISYRPVSESRYDLNADISFTPSMDINAEVSYIFSGYGAMGLREAMVLLPKDKIKDIMKDLVSLAAKPEDILKYDITGEAFENYSSGKPMIIKASVKAPQLIEKAGPKYLFRIGDVIGKQSEMYQPTERKQPIDIDFPHSLTRVITVTLPEGYKILNPEVLTMKTEFKDEKGTVTAAFTTDYKLEGNRLVVNVSEYYGQVHYRIEDFEPFRKVINASADFNKVTLLLGKG